MKIRAVVNCCRQMPHLTSMVVGLCLCCLAGSPATMPAGQKAEPPSAAAERQAMKLAREVYRDELAAAKTAEQKAQLAHKMADAATAEKKDPTGRFALLVLARDTGVEAGDIETAIAAIDEIGDSYRVDPLKLKHEAAVAAVKSLRTTEQRQRFCEYADPLIAALAQEDRYEPARQLAESALALARQSGDPKLVRQAVSRLQEVREAQSAFGEARVAQAALKRKPDDADAALRLGRYRCLIKGDWESGLPMLAKGGDPALRKLAEQDLAGPSAPEDEVGLGDGWWAMGERVSGIAKAQVRQRACTWYGKALSGLDKGLVRQKIEQRIQETTASASAEKPAGQATAQNFRWSDLPRYANLRLVPSWERLRPRKTLQAQTIKGAMTLARADSPYLVIGFLAVEPDATLTIEPGVTVLFAPGAQLSNKGTLIMKSEGDWIVLAPAERGQKWKGVYSRGRITARQCLVVGADRGLWIEEVKDGLAAAQCVFAGNGSGVMAGDHSNCSLEDCLLFKNDNGLMTGGGGGITFSRCLLVSNGKGYAADYSGRCAGTHSTLFANGIGVESGVYGDANELHLCNILGNTRFQAATRGDGASINVRQNYWGQDVAHAIAAGQARTLRGKVDAIEWLESPVMDALPSLPRCEYLAF